MTNEEIQQKAFAKVRRHEKKHHRNCYVHQADGFDLISKNKQGNIVRHIEIKGSTKQIVNFRWLEQLEVQVAET